MTEINLVDANFTSNNTDYHSEDIDHIQFDWLDEAFNSLLLIQFC